jgi:hypothetical protein
MPSLLGGNQLHLEHDGSFEYELPSVIPGGSYNLSCRIVNIHQTQVPLLLTVDNDDKDDALVGIYNIEIDYTGGEWKTRKLIEIQVAPGGRLKFERETNCHGLSIKTFTLDLELSFLLVLPVAVFAPEIILLHIRGNIKVAAKVSPHLAKIKQCMQLLWQKCFSRNQSRKKKT